MAVRPLQTWSPSDHQLLLTSSHAQHSDDFLVIEAEPGWSIIWDGNDGDHYQQLDQCESAQVLARVLGPEVHIDVPQNGLGGPPRQASGPGMVHQKANASI